MKTLTNRSCNIIAEMIAMGKLDVTKVSSFSVDRCRIVSEDVSITLMARTYASDLFYLLIPMQIENGESTKEHDYSNDELF